MNNIFMTEHFLNWIKGLKDEKGRFRILLRLRKAENGNFGDCQSLGEGVSEMRVHFGPGYRVYFGQEGKNVYLLLAGGDKGSQERDVRQAQKLWKELKVKVHSENH